MEVAKPEVAASEHLVDLTAEVVSAYIGHNSISVADLPRLIGEVHSALRGLSSPAEPPAEVLKPAVPIRRSVSDDFIVCLEDGKRFKSLKRHLRTHYDLSPDEYRARWGLPSDYPMVAPSYSQTRSALAKSHGLGRKVSAIGRRKRTAKSTA
jgi:predicted transcriptional regulator